MPNCGACSSPINVRAEAVAAGRHQLSLSSRYSDRHRHRGAPGAGSQGPGSRAVTPAGRAESDHRRHPKPHPLRHSHRGVGHPGCLRPGIHPHLRKTRLTLGCDRAIIYQFDENWQGTIVSESVGAGWPRALGAQIADPCFAKNYVEKYSQGRVQATADIQQAGLTECHLQQLRPFGVRANLVTPIVANEKLVALLIAHQCSGPRSWQQREIDYLTQVGRQVGVALGALGLLEARLQEAEEQRLQKEVLQRDLLRLIEEVEGVSRGDLTVRAEIEAGEIGVVADFFNAIIESLRGLVVEIKQAALTVSSSLGENETAITQLAEEAAQQASQTNQTLSAIAQMSQSIQAVASNAKNAAAVARTASTVAVTGGEAMDRTVTSILELRAAVADTAKKVKRLGEASQQISKAVSIINEIALKTNLLAVNASIEAARAGEEGRGFAVVAEEVGALATQSAKATKEIEKIVEAIQRETAQVVEAMETGTAQVAQGTHLVAQTKESLAEIVEVSRQIDGLLQSISTATVSQAQTSQSVTELMQQVAAVSERTSGASHQISTALQTTVAIAQHLQASVQTFKVGDGLVEAGAGGMEG
ncbi:MAG: GAF domain-containing protein [Chloroflexaceae bacterium]|nr:GAF domain-containing protein [Chloroflexaceae bacterium]